jgi:hypothetical protein
MIKSSIRYQLLTGAAALSLCLFLTGCGLTLGKPSNQPSTPPPTTSNAQVSVFLKDAPADDVIALDLTLTDAALFDAGGMRYPILNWARPFELRHTRLAPTPAVSLATTNAAAFSTLEVGWASPRLTLVAADGSIQQLTETTTPSVTLSSSTIPIPTTLSVSAGQSQGVMLDLDVKSSLWVDANGNYVISPVVKATPVTSTDAENELSMSLVKVINVQSSANTMDVQLLATGDTLHIKVDSNTQFDAAIGKFSNVTPGQMIEVEAKFQTDGSYLAVYVNPGAPDPTLRFQGVVMAIDQSGTNPVAQLVTQ